MIQDATGVDDVLVTMLIEGVLVTGLYLLRNPEKLASLGGGPVVLAH